MMQFTVTEREKRFYFPWIGCSGPLLFLRQGREPEGAKGGSKKAIFHQLVIPRLS